MQQQENHQGIFDEEKDYNNADENDDDNNDLNWMPEIK